MASPSMPRTDPLDPYIAALEQHMRAIREESNRLYAELDADVATAILEAVVVPPLQYSAVQSRVRQRHAAIRRSRGRTVEADTATEEDTTT